MKSWVAATRWKRLTWPLGLPLTHTSDVHMAAWLSLPGLCELVEQESILKKKNKKDKSGNSCVFIKQKSIIFSYAFHPNQRNYYQLCLLFWSCSMGKHSVQFTGGVIHHHQCGMCLLLETWCETQDWEMIKRLHTCKATAVGMLCQSAGFGVSEGDFWELGYRSCTLKASTPVASKA